MKAAVCTRYGLDNLKLEEVPKPVPKDDEALIKIFASSVTTQNLVLVTGKPFFVRMMTGGLTKPKYKILGSDIAGKIEAVGSKVKQFKPGDDVYGILPDNSFGAFAGYVSAPETCLAMKPANLTYEEAASVPESALVALLGLRDFGKIQKGWKVLIYSASGGIGTFVVQIAKYYGAEVTGVCSTRNLDMVQSLGADHVIDYTKEDFSKNGQLYDLIFAVRKSRSVWAIRRALKPGGIYVSTMGPSISRMIQEFFIGPRLFKGQGKQVRVIITKIDQKDLVFLKDLCEGGKLRPVIDKVYPLNETAEAFRYYGKGHARGKVVITIGQDGK
jgi:NADPH:quinone reductase-like Zn-dependent oxidoreductase